MVYNYNNLWKKIRKSGLTTSEIARKMNLSYCALRSKLDSRRQFSMNEIKLLCKILDIPSEDIDLYFFKNKLRKRNRFVKHRIPVLGICRG